MCMVHVRRFAISIAGNHGHLSSFFSTTLATFAALYHDVGRPLLAPWTARPRILFTASSLILPPNENKPLRLAFGLVNRGDADGTVTIKDRTYCFSVDPSEKRFKYLPCSPQEQSPCPRFHTRIIQARCALTFASLPRNWLPSNPEGASLLLCAG